MNDFKRLKKEIKRMERPFPSTRWVAIALIVVTVIVLGIVQWIE